MRQTRSVSKEFLSRLTLRDVHFNKRDKL